MSPATNKIAIPRTPRVLSIQSHVVSGYCGNKSATFPLQLLEFEVDVVNSVQLSNHTQYKVARGQIFSSKDLEQIHNGLKENSLLKLYDSILSGYVADVSYIESMAKLISEIKQERKKLGQACLYTLDPVLGDDGIGFYVPNGPKVAEAYQRLLVPLADIITPNRFEASILSGVDIDTKSEDAIKQAVTAIDIIHRQSGIKVVVITSLQLEVSKDSLVCIVSYRAQPSQAGAVWTITVPKLDCPFTGTGDLFTALLSGWLQKTNFDIEKSLECTANAIHDILKDTVEWYHQIGDNSVQSYELRLVQNKDKIIHPSDRLKAIPLDMGTGTTSLSDMSQILHELDSDSCFMSSEQQRSQRKPVRPKTSFCAFSQAKIPLHHVE